MRDIGEFYWGVFVGVILSSVLFAFAGFVISFGELKEENIKLKQQIVLQETLSSSENNEKLMESKNN